MYSIIIIYLFHLIYFLFRIISDSDISPLDTLFSDTCLSHSKHDLFFFSLSYIHTDRNASLQEISPFLYGLITGNNNLDVNNIRRRTPDDENSLAPTPLATPSHSLSDINNPPTSNNINNNINSNNQLNNNNNINNNINPNTPLCLPWERINYLLFRIFRKSILNTPFVTLPFLFCSFLPYTFRENNNNNNNN